MRVVILQDMSSFKQGPLNATQKSKLDSIVTITRHLSYRPPPSASPLREWIKKSLDASKARVYTLPWSLKIFADWATPHLLQTRLSERTRWTRSRARWKVRYANASLTQWITETSISPTKSLSRFSLVTRSKELIKLSQTRSSDMSIKIGLNVVTIRASRWTRWPRLTSQSLKKGMLSHSICP